MTSRTKPFLKWAGGKKQLLPEIIRRFPLGIDKYAEPFVGAGSVFLNILQRFDIDKYYISDINKDLILSYNTIKNNLDELSLSLKDIVVLYSKSITEEKEKLYYNVRDQFNKNTSDDIERVTQFIFLNKSCFNGIFRVNLKGMFNVPFSYNKILSIDVNNIERISYLLNKNNLKICATDFCNCESFVDNNTFVYFDPPYYTSENNFTSYSKDDFKNGDHIRLANFFKLLDEKGAKLMLSNSDSEYLRGIYSGYNIETVLAKRSINSNGNDRGKVKELLITNYRTQVTTTKRSIQNIITI